MLIAIRKERLESEESLNGFGLDTIEKTYYTSERISSTYRYPDILCGFRIQTSGDIINNTRSIYNALDFLGDVGGLFDMLCIVGNICLQFLTFIFGSGLDSYLVTNLFKTNDLNAEDPLENINQRTPLRIRAFSLFLGRTTPEKRRLQKGLSRIDKQQDFVRFVKK